MRRLIFLSLMALFQITTITAQKTSEDLPFSDLPPTNEYGKCYAKCRIPDQYETVSISVLVKPSSKRSIRVPAQYDTQTERVLVKEGGVSYRTIPATYKTISEQMLVEGERTSVKTIPARYQTGSRKILVTEAHGEWVKKKKAPNCFSQNPEDCYVACYEEIPATYRTETYQEELTPARNEQVTIPARYTTVSKRVIDQPAKTVEIQIEPEYRTVTRKVIVQPETVREEETAAVYKNVQEKRLIKKGGFTVWTEILCGDQTTSTRVTKIQRILKEKGMYGGPLDGVMGIKTQAALKQYQIENNLPIGNLNMETINSLGINTIE